MGFRHFTFNRDQLQQWYTLLLLLFRVLYFNSVNKKKGLLCQQKIKTMEMYGICLAEIRCYSGERVLEWRLAMCTSVLTCFFVTLDAKNCSNCQIMSLTHTQILFFLFLFILSFLLCFFLQVLTLSTVQHSVFWPKLSITSLLFGLKFEHPTFLSSASLITFTKTRILQPLKKAV